MTARAVRLCLLCHASTDAVRSVRFGDDEGLDEFGRKAAAAVRVRSDGRCWAGPERACAETAAALGLMADVEPALRDCDYGRWRGRALDAVAAEEPDALATWLGDPASAPHGGETLQAVIGRVGAWMSRAAARPGPVLALAGAAVIRAAVVVALGAPPAAVWRIDVAPLTAVRLNGLDGRWTLTGLGPLD